MVSAAFISFIVTLSLIILARFTILRRNSHKIPKNLDFNTFPPLTNLSFRAR